ncbi:MAG: hypothetical protein Q8Q29_01460 [Actinomycetota bacterium]|nr:hypothetical protein [Actinomycetota bacterium]
MAGRSDEASSRQRVGVWFSPERILWGYDDSIWALYEVPYQPITFLISSDDVIVDMWFGALSEGEIRARVEALAEVG